jgi:riboflavin kinase / FMN adenylyltransferase
VKVVRWESLADDPLASPSAATVGVFDGLHRGHTALIARVLSQSPGLAGAAFTFSDNPKKILRPEAFQGDLMSLERKMEVLESLGVSTTVLIDFSDRFGKLSGSEFLTALKNAGRVEYLAVGRDFRCGYGLDTGAERAVSIFASLGARAEIVEPVLSGGFPISSSRIRELILGGGFREAADLLGRPFEIDVRALPFRIENGKRRIEKRVLRQIVPPVGEYPVRFVGTDPSDGSVGEGSCVIAESSFAFRYSGEKEIGFIEFGAS